MSTLPVYNSVVPHLSLIPGGLRHGSMLRLKGQMNHGANRFSINIQTGAAVRPRDDTNLHLSVRPSDGAIVRNTYQNQVWGNEERYGGCPIYPGSQFDIVILAEHSAFKIAINGTHFCQFNHRLPLNTARYLSINGDCVMISMLLEQDSYPGGGAPTPYPLPIQAHPFPQPPPCFPGGPVTYPKPYPPLGGHHVPQPPPLPPPFRPYPGLPGHNRHHNHHNPNHVPNRPHWIHPRTSTEPVNPAALSHTETPEQTKKKQRNKAIKYAAGIGAGLGGIGLGAFALSRALAGDSDSDTESKK